MQEIDLKYRLRSRKKSVQQLVACDVDEKQISIGRKKKKKIP